MFKLPDLNVTGFESKAYIRYLLSVLLLLYIYMIVLMPWEKFDSAGSKHGGDPPFIDMNESTKVSPNQGSNISPNYKALMWVKYQF